MLQNLVLYNVFHNLVFAMTFKTIIKENMIDFKNCSLKMGSSNFKNFLLWFFSLMLEKKTSMINFLYISFKIKITQLLLKVNTRIYIFFHSIINWLINWTALLRSSILIYPLNIGLPQILKWKFKDYGILSQDKLDNYIKIF